jgi:SAM-dependent methyltransferase
LPIEHLIADKRTFDLVILRGVLHHCEDPADLINQASQLSNSILILEPNRLNPILKIIEKLSPYHRAHSEKSFTKAKIRTWLLTSGLSIQEFERGVLVSYFFPTALVNLMSSLEPVVARIPFLGRVLMGTQVILAFKNIAIKTMHLICCRLLIIHLISSHQS